MWTTPADLRAQVQKLWDKGLLLASLAGGEALFPRRLTLKGPSTAELSERFDTVRAWIAELRRDDGRHYRVVMREVRHRQLGANAVPDEVWIDSLDAALALIGKSREARRFSGLLETTRQCQPALLPWLQRRPLKALELAVDWPLLLEVAAWLQAHPRPGVYLRQVDIPGVHSKFIENQRGVLAELLDLILPPEAIDPTASGTGQFCRRYGFRDKPLRIRFRVLDPRLALLPGTSEQDITVDQATFNHLEPPARRVFVTENEVNFLAFPNVADSLVIFGAGYGFDVLAEASWLQHCRIHYWGDIDTHGFAILDQLRSFFPAARSLLMDRGTLMVHERLWGEESQPLRRDLPRLNGEDAALYDELRDNRIRPALRLEQERIGYEWLKAALAAL